MSDMNAAKRNLRRSILSTLAKANPVDLRSQSESVFKKLMMCPEYLRNKKVCVYLNTPLEVETDAILLHMFQEKMECYVPHFDKNSTYMDMIQIDSLEEARNLPVVIWQIRQPRARTDSRMSLETGGLDSVIVPGVAFTKQGHRLGHGKGYYDRYLRRHFELFNRKPYTIGLAFRQQIVDALPMSEFDVKLDLVIFA